MLDRAGVLAAFFALSIASFAWSRAMRVSMRFSVHASGSRFLLLPFLFSPIFLRRVVFGGGALPMFVSATTRGSLG